MCHSLVNYRIGRVILHCLCSFRDRHWKWHFLGVQKELSWVRMSNTECCVPTCASVEGMQSAMGARLIRLISLLLLTSLLAIFASGCASGVKFPEYCATVPPPPEGTGRVWFYRPSGLGAAVQPAVKLDDQTVGSAVPYGFFHMETQPGTHEVSATTEWKHKTSIVVTTNSDSYVRLNMMMGLFVGHVIPKEVAESQALKDMKNLHLVTK